MDEQDKPGTPEQQNKSTFDLMFATDPGLMLGVMHHRVATLQAVGGNLDAYRVAWAEIAKTSLT